jgi:hypothetical protein
LLSWIWRSGGGGRDGEGGGHKQVTLHAVHTSRTVTKYIQQNILSTPSAPALMPQGRTFIMLLKIKNRCFRFDSKEIPVFYNFFALIFIVEY